MKIFINSWTSLFDYLAAWQSLSLEARQFFIAHIGNDLRVIPGRRSDQAVDELRTAGLLAGNTPVMPNTARFFRRVIRTLYRHPIFDCTTPGLEAYLPEHFTEAGCRNFFPGKFHSYSWWSNLAELVQDDAWVGGFLKPQDPMRWENSCRRDSDIPYFIDPAIPAKLVQIIKRCLDGGNPLPWTGLQKDHRSNPAILSAALNAGIRYGLLFPALRTATLDPVIGLLPGVYQRMTRIKAVIPVPVDAPPGGALVSDAPFLLYDMTTLLVRTEPDGLRIKSVGGLFKQVEDELAALLTPVPEVLGECADLPTRLQCALHWLLAMKYVIHSSGNHKTRQARAYVSTAEGRAWLATGTGARWEALLDALRNAHQGRIRNAREWTINRVRFASGLPREPHWDFERELDPQVWLIKAFEPFPVAAWWPREGFLDWQCQTVNPLLNRPAQRSQGDSLLHRSAAEEEFRWRQYLESFLNETLLPLGGLRTQVDAAGKTWHSLTPAGAYLLGRTDTFAHEAEPVRGGIIIQPNFEIVFTAAAPAAESDLARVAERVGHGVGTLLRLTRSSVLAAVDAGISADDLLQLVTRYATRAVPSNVKTQLRDWAASYRRVSVRPATLIQCSDADTALHLRSLFPRLVVPLTETLLEVTNPDAVPAMTKKLKQHGLGVQQREQD